MRQSPSLKASNFSASQEIPAICGTQSFISAFHFPPTVPILSQNNPVHDQISHSVNIHFNIILPLTPRYSKWSISITSLHQNPVSSLLSSICATCPAYLILLVLIIREECRTNSSSLCSLFHSHVTSSLLGRYIFLSTLFSISLSLCFPYNARDHVSNPYKTQGKIKVLYILIFIFFDCKLEDTIFCTEL